MASFEEKKSYEELLAENEMLKTKCEELTKENKRLEGKLQSLQNNQGYEICEYFNECNSLKETADHFLYEDIVECGYALMEFNDCSDSICDAKDYKEFRLLAYGEESEEEDSDGDSDEDSDEESEEANEEEDASE